MDSNKHRTYFELTCEGCKILLKRRSDKKTQSPYCRKCRGKKTLTTHNESFSRTYKIWQGMKQRCLNSNDYNYKYYGGKGVQICQEWHDYKNFSNWVKQSNYQDHLTIERINVNGNYCPENCTWITIGEQALNRTNSLSHRHHQKL
jgi:hypothetical protein